MKRYAILAAVLFAFAAAMHVDDNGVPLRATIEKSVCANYAIKGESFQQAIAYPSWIGYEAIGNSGAYWIWYFHGTLIKLRVDSLTFGPLYGDGESGPTSCTP